MEKKELIYSFVLFAILSLAICILFSYSKIQFTGFAVSSSDFSNLSEGTFVNTNLSENGIILINSSENGTYTSKIFGNGEQVIWSNFSYIKSPSESVISFYIRNCENSMCSGRDFIALPENLNVISKYFQYKVEIQNTPGISPKVSGVNVSYILVPVISLPIVIESPQNITYNNQSILIKILSNVSNSTIWFNEGSANTTYTEEIFQTFSEGSHTLNVFVSDLEGNINSSSIVFSVLLPQEEPYCGDDTCDSDESCNSCADDCGECEEETKTTTSNEPKVEIPTTKKVTPTSASSCAPNWQCGEWQECINKTQIRVCTDTKNCKTQNGIPATSQSCVMKETCFDKIKNQNESGVDCGGPCKNKCGFFTLVGNAISGPKGVFSNITKVIVFIGVFVLLLGGIASLIIFKKKKNLNDIKNLFKKLFKFKENNSEE